MRPHTAGLVCLVALLLGAALCSAQPSYAKNKRSTYPKRSSYPSSGGGSYSRDHGGYGGGDYHSGSDPYGGYHHKRTKTGTKPAALSGDLELDVNVCSIGFPGAVSGANPPSPLTSSVAIWFKLNCEEAPVDPDVDDDSDYGYGGGYGGYDRGYDRGGYSGGGYKHHNKNYTKRHDYEEYGGYRRRLQAMIVVDIGECLLTGISPVGIALDLDTSAEYNAQVSGKCTLKSKAKRCHAQFGGINALGAGASFTLLGGVKLEYVKGDGMNANKVNAMSLLDITSFFNGPAQLGGTTLNSLPLTRFNVGQVTLNLEDCKCNNFPEGDITDSAVGDGTLALAWSI